jgi:hypothetical protein
VVPPEASAVQCRIRERRRGARLNSRIVLADSVSPIRRIALRPSAKAQQSFYSKLRMSIDLSEDSWPTHLL